MRRCLAVIPARGGSKGLPGKNLRPFAGLPLIAHSILLAKLCPEVGRIVVSTDSPEIARTAKSFGAEVPFLRPAELARDETPLWPVIRHALSQVDAPEGADYETVLLLDPTSPAREPGDIAGSFRLLDGNPAADGVIGVSRPDFNPIWHCVVEKEGWMSDLFQEGGRFERRQDLPPVYRINGSLYLWRSSFVRGEEIGWRQNGKHRIFEIPELRAMSFDTLEEFDKAELLVTSGLIRFPWLSSR